MEIKDHLDRGVQLSVEDDRLLVITHAEGKLKLDNKGVEALYNELVNLQPLEPPEEPK